MNHSFTRLSAGFRSRSKTTILFLLFAPIVAMYAQSTIRVPQDASSVQAGVDAASDGDTVLVDEGVYTENIVVRKKIILASLYARDKDTSHISRTILDGSSPRNADSAAVVTFDAGTDTTSILMGLTVRGGKGNLRGSYRVGGGIDIFAGGARIVRNWITGNNATNATSSRGGGISIWNPFATANIPYVIIESNVISRNTIQGSYAEGAGVSLSHPGRIAGNVIERNEAIGTNTSLGGGISISGNGASVEIFNNIVANNRSSLESGGFSVTTGAEVTFVNNTIVYNSSRGAEGGRVTQATIRVMNNIFWNPGDGAEIAVSEVRTLAAEYYVQNNLIRSNFYGENINVDPALTDTIGFTLSPGSPCISRGVDTATLGGMLVVAPSTDIHGNIRPNSANSRPDLGAVESAFETSSPFTQDSQQWLKTMISQDRERVYSLFLPKNYVDSPGSFPLVIALTGAGGTYEFGVAVGLQNIADKEGFVLVSPQPFMNAWTGGNNANLQSLEDVIFISELLDSLIASYKIDTNRVYLCGLSSGAFLSFRVAAHLSDRITAIGTVAGTMPSVTAQTNPPTHAVAVVMFNGTSDAGVPYGGKPPYQQSVDSTVIKWRSYNGCDETFVVEDLPDIDPTDGTTVQRFVYSNCSSGKAVMLYKINGGAHNWPGLVTPLLPPQTMDIFASAEIFKFFNSPLSGLIAVEDVTQEIPSQYHLEQNYPNPFNPSTKIQFSVVSYQLTVLKIYDLLGREVATLVNEELSPGSYEVTWDATGFPSGVYFYRLSAGELMETKRLILLR